MEWVNSFTCLFYVVDPKSEVARNHPDWVIKDTLDLSNSQVVEYLKNQLDEFAGRFGPFELKNDGWFTTKRGADDTPLLKEDEVFRFLIRHHHSETPFGFSSESMFTFTGMPTVIYMALIYNIM